MSRYAFAHGKMSNKVGLQDTTYQEVRTRLGLPAQMAYSVPRQVGATYKALWTKVKANTAARQAGRTEKHYKGLDQPPKHVSPTLTYQLGHDYSCKTAQRMSLLTQEGRVIGPCTGYARHVALIGQGAQMGVHIDAAKLWYDKPRKRFYLLVSLDVEVAAPTPQMQQRVVGVEVEVEVEVGHRSLAVATDAQNQMTCFAGKAVRAQADPYARLRKRLQHQGTRWATRRVLVRAGRARRVKHDRNPLISRRSVDAYPHALVGLEDLPHLRERTKRTHGKKASVKQRRANGHASTWVFAELHGYLAYKALLAGSMAVKVDAYHTSQCCPRCGYTAADNRPEKGLLLVCQVCRLVLHADVVGARTIALRTLLARQDWVRMGVLSERPDVSNDEAKAAQRRRCAELRWSLDTSPAL